MERTIQNPIIQSQLNWLSTLVMENGEFVTYNSPSKNSYRIVPYFSNVAALALLEDPSKVALVKKYIIWYTSHLNFPDKFGANGTIYDYWLKTNGELVSGDDYDSNDSYPATFMNLCKKYFEVSGDYRFFQLNKKYIDSIVESMVSTMDCDNLTWAKPNYKIKYLMDNCEVFEGLKNASEFYKLVYKDDKYSNKLSKLAEASKSAIENNMWYSSKGYYYPLIDNGGGKDNPNLKKWYPDATAQLFPILCGVISADSQKAVDIYNKFNLNHPDWHIQKEGNDFPDTYIGYIALMMKDYDRVSKFLDFCINRYIKNNNSWPWYSVECAYFIRTMLKFEEIKNG